MDLGDGYRPVLSPALAAQADAMGVARESLRASSASRDLYGTTVDFAELFGVEGGVVGLNVERDARRTYLADPE